MMNIFTVRTTFLTALLVLAPATGALAHSTEGSRFGTVSACGSTLDEMEQAVHAKMDKMGGSHYVITSARMGNRTAGTAIIFK